MNEPRLEPVVYVVFAVSLLIVDVVAWVCVATYIDEWQIHPVRLGWALAGGVVTTVFAALCLAVATIRYADLRTRSFLERRLPTMPDEGSHRT